MSTDSIELQRAYYAATAGKYDDMHGSGNDEHEIAFDFMLAFAGHAGVASILDIGSGTGRALLKIREKMPRIRAVGVEPSRELREVGYSKGLSPSELVDGDAMKLDFEDGAFDLVCEFAALHHMPYPSEAVSEMLRVAKVAVFISDSNNFGQGGRSARFFKQLLNDIGVWPIANYFKTRGKGYTISEGDGLAYSYSVFNDLNILAKNCKAVHMLNTMNSGPNLYRSAPHVALLGVK